MKAMSVAYSVLDVIAGKAPEKVDKKGKKGDEKKKEKPVKQDEGKKGKKGSKDKIQAGAALATTPLVETPPPPLDPSIPPATAREHAIFLHRMQRIGDSQKDSCKPKFSRKMLTFCHRNHTSSPTA